MVVHVDTMRLTYYFGNFNPMEVALALTKQDREMAVNRALANAALEGLQPDEEFSALLDRYIAGDMTMENAIEQIKAQYRQTPTGSES